MKKVDKSVMGVRIDNSIRHKVEYLAEKERRNISNMLEIIILAYIHQYESKNGQIPA